MLYVKDERGRVIRLVHFRHCARHLELLKELQRDQTSQNMPVAVDTGSTRCMMPLFQIVLDDSEVRALNPNEAANDTTQIRRAR